nr:BTAD domain-containing putative transcriptional regulator [Amycolatopsis rhizosphaerae]
MLTPREFDVLRAIGRGLSNAEIATALVISEMTVKTHVGRIFAKLGLRDRAAAIVYAFDHGVVTPGEGQDLLVHRGEPEPPVPTPVPASAPAPPWRAAVTAPGARLYLSVLGPPAAWRDGRPLDLGPVRQQALLAALLLHPGVTVSKRELLDGIWEFDAPAGNVVPVYVYRLRQCLRTAGGEPALITRDRGGYRFAGDGVEVDAVRLEEFAAQARAAEREGDLAAAVEARSRALELFRGEPLAGLPGPFAASQRARLAERRMSLWLEKLDGQLRLGRHSDAVGPLSALSEANPHSEPVAALLMRAFYAGGRQADALAVYGRIRDELVTELGVEPGQELRRVHQAVLRDDAVTLGLAPSWGTAGR